MLKSGDSRHQGNCSTEELAEPLHVSWIRLCFQNQRVIRFDYDGMFVEQVFKRYS